MLAVAGGIILASVILALVPLVIETIIEFPSAFAEVVREEWHNPGLRWALKWLLIGFVIEVLVLGLLGMLGLMPE